MSGKLSRIAVFAAALAAFGIPGALSSTASAATTSTASMHFIDWYSSQTACEGGGAYYVRHGYSSYYCLRETAGWGLYVWD